MTFVRLLLTPTTAIPKVIASPNAALGTFIPSVIILAFASGFIKPSVGPLLCDQSPVKEPTIAYRGGQKVIIDPGVTVERYLLIFYMMINLGGIFPVSLVERFSVRRGKSRKIPQKNPVGPYQPATFLTTGLRALC